MSNHLKKYDASGNLEWSIEVENFTGKSVVDYDGNVYALLNGTSTGDSGVAKYSPDGELIDVNTSYTLMRELWRYNQPTRDICFCRIDEDAPCLALNPARDRICIVGGQSTTGYEKGHLVVMDTDLFHLYSNQTGYIQDDYFTQVEADNLGNVYIVGGNQQAIYKYDVFDYSSGWEPAWVNSSFIFSSVTPVIATTNAGLLYISGEAHAGVGAWVSVMGPSYWTPSSPAVWTGSEYSLPSDGNIELSVYGSWADTVFPKKIRFTYDIVSTSTGQVAFNVYGGYLSPNVERRTSQETGTIEIEIPFENWWQEAYFNNQLSGIELEIFFGDATGTTISNIELYVEPQSQGIFAIYPDETLRDFSALENYQYYYNEPIIDGYQARSYTIEQILVTSDGDLLIKEDDSRISLIDPSVGTIWTNDTGESIEEILPGIDGFDIAEPEVIANLAFDSTVYVLGHEAEAVYPEGNILFSQPEPILDYSQLTINVIPGQLTFQSTPTIPTILNELAGNISFDSNASVVVPLVADKGSVVFSSVPTVSGQQTIIKPLGELEFYSNLDAQDISAEETKLTIVPGNVSFACQNPEITGERTIVKSTGELNFSSEPEISGAYTIVKPIGSLEFNSIPDAVFAIGFDLHVGAVVLTSPGEISFNSIPDINKETIYTNPIKYKLGFKSNPIVIGDGDNLGEIEMSFPSLNTTFYSGASLETELYKLVFSGNLLNGHTGYFNVDFPTLTFNSYAGSLCEIIYPSFDLVLTAVKNVLADLDINFSSLNFSGTLSDTSEGSIGLTWPKLKFDLTANIGLVGSLATTMPMFEMQSTGLYGNVADFVATLRTLEFSSSGYPSGDATIEITFPAITTNISSGNIESEVLRYVRSRVR